MNRKMYFLEAHKGLEEDIKDFLVLEDASYTARKLINNDLDRVKIYESIVDDNEEVIDQKCIFDYDSSRENPVSINTTDISIDNTEDHQDSLDDNFNVSLTDLHKSTLPELETTDLDNLLGERFIESTAMDKDIERARDRILSWLEAHPLQLAGMGWEEWVDYCKDILDVDDLSNGQEYAVSSIWEDAQVDDIYDGNGNGIVTEESNGRSNEVVLVMHTDETEPYTYEEDYQADGHYSELEEMSDEEYEERDIIGFARISNGKLIDQYIVSPEHKEQIKIDIEEYLENNLTEDKDTGSYPYSEYMAEADDEIVGEDMTRAEARELAIKLKNTAKDYIYITCKNYYERDGHRQESYEDIVDVNMVDGQWKVFKDAFNIFRDSTIEESNLIESRPDKDAFINTNERRHTKYRDAIKNKEMTLDQAIADINKKWGKKEPGSATYIIDWLKDDFKKEESTEGDQIAKDYIADKDRNFELDKQNERDVKLELAKNGIIKEDLDTNFIEENKHLLEYLYSEIVDIDRRGNAEVHDDYLTYQDIIDTYSEDITEEQYNKCIQIIKDLAEDVKYYRPDGGNALLQLSDNHTMFQLDLDPELDGLDEIYWGIADKYLQAFEEETGVEPFAEGRSSRHICVANTFDNFLNYNKLQEYQKVFEQQFIDFMNTKYGKDDIEEEVEKPTEHFGSWRVDKAGDKWYASLDEKGTRSHWAHKGEFDTRDEALAFIKSQTESCKKKFKLESIMAADSQNDLVMNQALKDLEETQKQKDERNEVKTLADIKGNEVEEKVKDVKQDGFKEMQPETNKVKTDGAEAIKLESYLEDMDDYRIKYPEYKYDGSDYDLPEETVSQMYELINTYNFGSEIDSWTYFKSGQLDGVNVELKDGTQLKFLIVNNELYNL